MAPPGFLGTRANLQMDVIFAATLATPALLVWAVLVARSWKRLGGGLPRPFTPSHRRFGRWGFEGTVFGAASAVVMSVPGFVL